MKINEKLTAKNNSSENQMTVLVMHETLNLNA